MGPNIAVERTTWIADTPGGGSYQLAHVGPVLLVKLAAAPTPPMLAALSADIAIAHEETGDELIYVAVIPKNATPPAAEARPLMAEFQRYVSRTCKEVHVVVETGGFAGTILRSGITAVAMISRERNLTVHATLGQALGRLRSMLSPELGAELVRAARELGVVD